MDSKIVPSSLAEIAPFLGVADEIKSENLRVAYCCKSPTHIIIKFYTHTHT